MEKDSPTAELLGVLAELSAWIKVVSAFSRTESAKHVLNSVQVDLAEMGDQLRTAQDKLLSRQHVTRLEEACTKEALRVAPSVPEGATSAFNEVARAVCHRAERRMYTWLDVLAGSGADLDGGHGLAYLSKLSDVLLLFEEKEARADPAGAG